MREVFERQARIGILVAYFRISALLLLAALVGACGMPKVMPFSEYARDFQEKDGALFLMTVTMNNELRPSFWPNVSMALVEKTGVQGKPQRVAFSVEQDAYVDDGSEGSGISNLIRLQLEAGEYRLIGIN